MAKKYKTPKEKRASQRRYRRNRKRYENYLDQFEARKEVFESRGLEFYDPKPLSYRDWKTVHAEKINDLEQDIKEGKRKTIGNVNREIVSDQAYEFSSRQADVLAEYLLENEMEALEELNLVYKTVDENGVEVVNLKKKIDLYMKIRQGEFLRKDIGLWDIIRDFRKKLFERKMTKEEVRQAVGQTFFDSP